MKALILAAGYSTRLYPLTKDTPKPLLKINHKPIIEHIIEKLNQVDQIDHIYVVTNAKFFHHFWEWSYNLDNKKTIKIINDQTLSNEDRLGAVGDINYVLEKEKINDHLLVIAGDNLFGFPLQNFFDFFQEKNSTILAFHDLKDLEKVKNRFGAGILNGSLVTDFEEKPSNPRSTLAATACYLFKNKDLYSIRDLTKSNFLDNSGDLIKFLVNSSQVHGYIFNEHWFDIGTIESLKEAEQFYSR